MQGFNMGRYVPPEHEGSLSANQVSGKHVLGSRARKAGEGILTVRFEMPFSVWCSTCPKPTLIGQGVRFNAEKKKVGNYYSTPVWAFRMKHVECGGWVEIRTDPKNTDYEVTEGGKRRDTGDSRIREGDLEIKTDAERQKLREDAFAALEVTVDDRKQAATEKHRIEELHQVNDKDWSDPFTMNKRLRRTFRAERKDLERKAIVAEDLKHKMSLGIDLIEENDNDRERAAHMQYGTADTESSRSAISRAEARSLFQRSNSKPNGFKTGAEKAKSTLSSELRTNTRATLDVFGSSTKNKPKSLDLKPKATSREEPSRLKDSNTPTRDALVDYDSD